MLSVLLATIPQPAGGLPALPFAPPMLGVAGLAAAAVLIGLLGLLAAPAPPRADAQPEAGPLGTLERPAALLCAVIFGLKAALAGAVAWQAWTLLGPASASGLAAAAIAFAAAAIACGGRAVRRR